MLPSRAAGGMAQPSSSSGIFFQGDGQPQLAGNYQLSSLTGHARPSSVPFPGDASNALLNSVANSAPSVGGANSSVTDANSVLSGGAHMQRSASFNTESYMRLPASPMSFTSNNISISGSSVMDGSSVLQQSSNQDASLQAQQSQQHQGTSSATSLSTSRMGQVQVPGGLRGPNSFIQDPNNISQLQKKSHLDIKQEDILQQQVLQQLLQRNDQVHSQNSNPQLQALMQQQRLRQQREQQQLLQSVPPIQRVQLLQQQQQQQLRQQLIQQGLQPGSGIKRSYDGGVCSRRLMQYLYHQRQRPAESTIAYWRKFVTEYYSPRAKKRWCLALYDNVGHHSLGVFPQAAMDAWQCDICGSKSGRGFVKLLELNIPNDTMHIGSQRKRPLCIITRVRPRTSEPPDPNLVGNIREATFEVLPRLNEIKFASGVIDELLFLDLPREYRFPSGMMMLEYAKAVQESVYDQLRVVREGQLRIIFTPDLKILSWEFCARCHEELLPCRLVAPQAKQLLQVAQKCQSTLSDGGSHGVSQQDLQANSVLVVTAGRQLTRSLELQSLNDLGFSKRYVRCLQISEVVSSMKDLMDFCTEQKVGPVEGLKNFPHHASTAKVQMQKIQEMEQAGATLPADCNNLNKMMTIQNNNQHLVGRGGALAGSAQAALALTNYQNLMMRRNSMNMIHNNSLQQEASSPFITSSQALTPPISSGTLSGMQNPPVSGFSSGQTLQQQPTMSGNGLQQQTHSLPSQSNQALQQQMIQQLLHDMNNNNNAQQSVSGQNQGGNISRNGLSYRSSPATSSAGNGPGNVVGNLPNRTNCYKSELNSGSPALSGNSGFSLKASDLSQNLHLADDLVADVAREFTDNDFFNTDLDDNINFNWQA